MLELDVMGPMRARVDGAEIEVRGERRRMLLCALAVRAGRQVPVDELAEVLWGDRLPADPASSVHALVSRLRRDLGPEGSAVVTASAGYKLDASAALVDADEFVAAIRQLSEDDEEGGSARAEGVRRALRLWRGAAWRDLPNDDVAVARAATIADIRRTGLEILGSLCGDGYGQRSDLGTLERASEEFPFSESVACGLAVVRERYARKVEALRGLTQFIARVRDETGLDPSPGVLRLETRLIAGTDPSPPGLGDQTEGRTGLGMLDRLVGRDDDIDRLAAELRACRLVTVVGSGGVGKTVLAVATAREMAVRYPGGVYRCELAPVESPSAIPFALGEALGLGSRSGVTPMEQAIEFLASRPALLLLDNCEHLRAQVAATAEDLIASSHLLTVLATSREPLGLQAERRFELPPLSVAERDDASPSPAAELFRRRARDAGADDVLSSPDEVSEICTLLGGLPLAIELAASRCRSMTISELARAIKSDMSVVREPRSRRPHRHRDLETVIAQSHGSLTTEARRIFNAAAVFVGGFDRDAVCSMADPDLAATQVDDAIDQLVDKSLVLVDRQAHRARFSMLEPIRQHGLKQLEDASAVRATRDAHLALCRRYGRAIADLLSGPMEAQGVELARRELANLRAGHQHAIDTSQLDAAMELIAALHDFAIWRESYELGEWAERSLALPGAAEHHLAPVVYATAGWAKNKAGHYVDAVQLAEAGLQCELNGGYSTGWCHDVLAHTAYWTGDHETAVGWASEEVERARSEGDAMRVAYMLGDLAAHAALADPTDVESQIERNREAVDLATTAEVPSVLAFALHALGSSLRVRDDDEAEALLERSLEIAERVECRFVLRASAQNLAAIHCSRQDWNAAVAALEPTLRRFARGADPAHAGMVARVLVAPLDALLRDPAHTEDLAPIAGYGLGAPGPRFQDVDARNDMLVADWRRSLGRGAVDDLLHQGAEAETQVIVGRLLELVLKARIR